MYTRLHRSEFKISKTIRRTCSQLCSFMFEVELIFGNCCPNFTTCGECFQDFNQCYAKDQNLLILKFPEISDDFTENIVDFKKIIINLFLKS